MTCTLRLIWGHLGKNDYKRQATGEGATFPGRKKTVGTKLGGRPQPLRRINLSLVPDPRTRITVT